MRQNVVNVLGRAVAVERARIAAGQLAKGHHKASARAALDLRGGKKRGERIHVEIK